jgi:hypothetical protein
MARKPSLARQQLDAIRDRLLVQHEKDLQAAGAWRKLTGQYGAAEPVFTPQPYPLFLADWSGGDPMIGRIVGWSTTAGSVPEPVVAFEAAGQTWMPVRVDLATAMQKSGPVWIRESLDEAQAAIDTYRAQQQTEPGP